MPERTTCKSCWFMQPAADANSLPRCHRFPPQRVIDTFTVHNSERSSYVEWTSSDWPDVNPNTGWCGEFKHNPLLQVVTNVDRGVPFDP